MANSISFKGISAPPVLPLLRFKVLEGAELEEARERMREWLRKYEESQPGGLKQAK